MTGRRPGAFACGPPAGGGMQGRKSLRPRCHPISLVLPKETGVAPQRKTLRCESERFLRIFAAFQLSNVVIPSMNEFSASPTVHCFAYARGTADHHPVSGASEAKPTAAGDAEHPFDNGMTTHDTLKPVKDSSRLRCAPERFSLGRHTRVFGQDQRNGVAKGLAGARPCSCPPPRCGGNCPRPLAGRQNKPVKKGRLAGENC